MWIQIIVAFLITFILVVLWWKRRPSPTLYERVGGIYNIAMIVDHYSNALIDNPVVGKNSANPILADWHTNKLHRLPGLKFMRTLWVASITGGPFEYTQLKTQPARCPFSLQGPHGGLNISTEEYNAAAIELRKTLNHYNIDADDQVDLLTLFMIHRSDVIPNYPVYNVMHFLNCPLVFW